MSFHFVYDPFFAGWVHLKKKNLRKPTRMALPQTTRDRIIIAAVRKIQTDCIQTSWLWRFSSSSVNLYHQWGGSLVVILIIKKSMLKQTMHWWQNCTLPSTKRYTCANTFQNGCIQSSDLDVNTMPRSVHTSTSYIHLQYILILLIKNYFLKKNVNIFTRHDRSKWACLHCFQRKPNRLLPSKQWSVPNSCRYVSSSSWDC